MAWIQPLELQTWMVNVLSGSGEYFAAIALLVLIALSGVFRMTMLSMFFVISLFFLMFSDVLPRSLLVFIVIFGGFAVGLTISKLMK